MCMVDPYDSDGVLNIVWATRPKARIEHKCAECRRMIQRGETYVREVLRDGEAGTLRLYVRCAHCDVLCEWLNKNCGGYYFHMVLEDIQEHYAEYQRRDLGALVRLARKDWRWRGEVVRVPELPRPIEHEDLAA